MSDSKQKNFFNKKNNRYPESLVLNPNLHTIKETLQIIKRLKHLSKSDHVADFGAGSGRITLPLLENGFNVYAVDISQTSLDEIKKLSEKMNYKSLTTTYTLPKRKVKAVVGADVLHHVDLSEHLPLIFANLEKGGKIIFSEPNAFNFSWYAYLPIASSWEIEKGLMTCTYLNLRNKLEKAGFKNIKISGLGFLPRPLFTFSSFLCDLNDSLGNFPFLKLFSYRLIIEAEK